jgi:hypothetical protein
MLLRIRREPLLGYEPERDGPALFCEPSQGFVGSAALSLRPRRDKCQVLMLAFELACNDRITPVVPVAGSSSY